jgi:hypothetical protein
MSDIALYWILTPIVVGCLIMGGAMLLMRFIIKS